MPTANSFEFEMLRRMISGFTLKLGSSSKVGYVDRHNLTDCFSLLASASTIQESVPVFTVTNYTNLCALIFELCSEMGDDGADTFTQTYPNWQYIMIAFRARLPTPQVAGTALPSISTTSHMHDTLLTRMQNI
jgi:hypothetical protein